MCFRKRKPTEHPAGLTPAHKPMKQAQNKGGRPELSKGRVRRYIVSTRLDTEHYLRLRSLARTSGNHPTTASDRSGTRTPASRASGFRNPAQRHSSQLESTDTACPCERIFKCRIPSRGHYGMPRSPAKTDPR